MKRPIVPMRAKIHRSYTIAEAAELFGVHRNTVRAWTKRGLPLVDVRGGPLILGRELRPFLERVRRERKARCPAGTMFCLRCRAPRRPRRGTLVAIPMTLTSVNLRGECEACGCRIHRRCGLAKLAAAGFAEAVVQTGGLAPSR